MNSIYRLVWSRSGRQWIPVAETSRACGRGRSARASALRPSATILAAAAVALCGVSFVASAGPAGGQITSGSGSITRSGRTTEVMQNSDDLSINWQSFNVAANETVDFLQPGAASIAVNRIGGNSASQIFGHLNSNGQVWLINPNGVLFGKGAQVDVGSLAASTLDISDASLNVGNRTLSGAGTGSIVNQGSLRAADGGYIALLGNTVLNEGTLRANLGTVALGAGSAETLTFSGHELLHLSVDRSTLNSLVSNRQLIEANGGHVIMTAGASDTLLASVVNNSGVIEAHSLENDGGTIVLLAGAAAGTVEVGGTLDATAAATGSAGVAGGTIETSGAKLSVVPGARVVAGPRGTWKVDPTDLNIDGSAASAIDTSLDSGTSVTETTTATSASGYGTQSAGPGDITISSPLSWTNPAASLTLSAFNAVNVDATVSGAGPVVLQATNGNMNIASGASISGSAVTLSTGANFSNNGGANAVSAGAGGRWLVYSTNPSLDTTGGLTPGFVQYDAAAGAQPAAITGNAFIYSAAPAITVSALTGTVAKTYDGGTAATLTNANSNYTIAGLINGDSLVSMSGTYQSSDAGTGLAVTSALNAAGLTVTTAGGIPVYGYALTGTPLTAAIGTINPASLSAGIVGNPTKVYDGTTTATLSASNYQLTGFVGGQGATVNQPSSVAYASATAGAETVTAAFAPTNFVAGSGTKFSNYVLPTAASGAGTIEQAPLTVTGVLATGKVYDGTTADTLNTANAGIYGVIGNDSVTLSSSGAAGAFASANASSNIAVAASGFTLSGAQQADYRIVAPAGLYATISPASLTLTGVAATNKVYDGTSADPLNVASAALSGVIPGDAANVALSDSGAIGTFGSKNVGTQLPVAIAGISITGSAAANYALSLPMTLTANISPAALTVSLIGNPSKPYNGTTTAALTSSNFTLAGFVSGESATIPQIESGQYASSNAGTQTVVATLTAPDYSPGNGTLLSNYTLPSSATGTGTIAPAPLTGTLIGNPTKTYDGTSAASLSAANYNLSGFIAGQGATVNQTSGAYASANAGEQPVSATAAAGNYSPTGGTLLANYSLPTTFTGVGTIVPAAVTGTVYAGITGNPTKTYDGTTVATLTSANFTLSGFLSGQGATVTQTVGQYASANAGSQTVSAGLSSANFTANSGTNLSNYTLPTSAFGTGTIDPASLTVSIVGNPTRVYNGNTNMVLASGNYSIAGFVGGQGAQINPSALISYSSANAGSESLSAVLTPSAYTANAGTVLSNYVLASSASGTGTITPAPLAVTGVYATSKVYDTTNADPLNVAGAALAGVVPGDAANLNLLGTPSGAFGTSQVGSALPVAVSGYSLGGSAAPNYTLQPVSGLSAGITPAPLSITGVAANSKPYDGTNAATLGMGAAALAGVLGGDTVTLSAAGAAASFSSVNVGNNLKVAASGFSIGGAQAGDYALAQPTGLSASITPAPIMAVITGNPTKVYDGSASTTLIAANYTLTGFAPGQSATVPQSATASYVAPDAGSNVAINSTLVLSDFVAGSGTNLSNYQLPMAAAGVGTITQAPLTLSLIGNPTKTYDGTTPATLTSANFNLAGFVGSQSASISQTSGSYASANAGSQTVTAALSGGDYIAGTATNLANYALPAVASGLGTIRPASLSVSGVSTTPQTYNGTTVDALAGAMLSGTVYGADAPTLAPGTYSTGTLSNSGNAGTDSVTTNIGLTGAGSANYTLVQPSGLSAVISPAPLTASASVTKTYDGATTASLAGSNTIFGGFVAGQGATVNSGTTGTFSSSNVGSGLTVSGGALGSASLTANNGTLLSNYVLPSSDNGSGSITPAMLTYNAAASSQQYGITPSGLMGSVSGFVNGENLATATTGVPMFTTTATSSSNVGHYAIDGSGLTADNGNYIFSQASANATALTITPAPLSIVGVNTTSRAYNGSTVDALTGATLVGTFYNGDSPTLTNSSVGTLGNGGNVGTDSVTTHMGLAGPGAGDYSLAQPSGLTAVISPLALTATSSIAKTYDGTTSGSLSGANTTFTGFVAGQGATVKPGVTGTLASANVGSGIAVTGGPLTSSQLTPTGGTNLSNYTLPSSDNGTGTISPATVVVSGSRVYDGAADAAAGVFGSGGTVSGVSGQTLTLSGSGTLIAKNVGSETVSSLGTLALGNGTGLASNYTLSGGSVTVTPLSITVNAAAADKTYNGNATASVTLSSAGVLAGDALTFSDGSAMFASANAGANQVVNVSSITASGAGSGDYTLNTTATTTGTINPAIVNLSGTRVYDGATDAAASLFGAGGTVNGVNGQTLTLSGSGALASKNVGSESLSSLGSFALGNGTGLASNYTLSGGGDTLTITPATLRYVASSTTQAYGTTPSGLAGTVTGFVGGESLATATSGSASFTTTATAASNVGHYAINGTGLSADNGNYVFAQGSGNATALSIMPAVVNLSGSRGYDGATDAAASLFGSSGTVNGVNGQTLTLSGSGVLASKNVGSEAVSSLGTLALGNGSGLASNYTLTGGSDAITVAPATLSYQATSSTQTYGTTPSGLAGTLTGFMGGDTLGSATTGTASFSTAATAASNVGHYAVDGSGLSAGNYVFTQAPSNATALSITPATVNLSGARIYDGAADATASVFGSSGTVNGVNGQTLTLSGSGALTAKNVGSEAVSSLGSLALSNGTGLASNYMLTGGSDAVTVTPATLSYQASPSTQVYGTTPSGLAGTLTGFVGGETLATATSGTPSFATTATAASNVGYYAVDGSGLSAANGNYVFAQSAGNTTALSITPAIVNFSGTRIYDGAADAAASLFGSSGTVNGVNGQTLTLSGSGALAAKNVGSESLSSLGTLALGNGTGIATNYTLSGGSDALTVTPATLSYVASPATQAYGTTPAGIVGTVTGFAGVDTLGLATTGTASFASAATAASNVGHYAVNGSGLSAVNGNYVFAQSPGNATALTITPAPVNLSGARVYDGVTDAVAGVFGSSGTVNGVNGQTLTLSGSGALGSKNVGNESLSSLGTLALGNGTGLASNYTLSGGSDAINVTPLAITVSATGTNRIYDGNNLDAVTLASTSVLPGDALSFKNGSALFANANVGTGKAVMVGGITLTGADAVNYSANSVATTYANITPATLTETAETVTTAGGKVPALGGSVAGFVGSDTLANATTGALVWSTNASANPGIGTYAIDGSGLAAANYLVVQAVSNADALHVTALPETAPAERIDGLIGVPLSANAVATPYGIGSNNEYGNNTGNERQDPDPTDPNRRLSDFRTHVALTIESNGVRLPPDALATATSPEPDAQ